MSDTRFEEEKFEELVLYVAERCLDDPSFGATKLNKILFFSDFLAYQDLGHPITGAHYMRLDYGPAPRELLRTLNRLEEEGRARRLTRLHFGREQKRLVPLDEPHLSSFTAEEIALVDDVVETVRHSTAVAISEMSHRVAVGWQLAGHKEDIPYESVFLSSDSPSPRDLARGQELAEEHDWAHRRIAQDRSSSITRSSLLLATSSLMWSALMRFNAASSGQSRPIPNGSMPSQTSAGSIFESS